MEYDGGTSIEFMEQTTFSPAHHVVQQHLCLLHTEACKLTLHQALLKLAQLLAVQIAVQTSNFLPASSSLLPG